jgi:hypothetical protein
MRTELQDAFKRLGKSRDGLAKELLPRWQEIEPEAASRWKPRSLGAKIGDLLKDDDDRLWRAHPQLAALLADILEIGVEDILPETDAQDEKHFAFRDFPSARPLRPDEAPGDLVRFVPYPGAAWTWAEVSENVCGREPQHWIVLPPGGGKHLYSWLLEKTWSTTLPSVHSLSALAFTGTPSKRRRVKRVIVPSVADARPSFATNDDCLVLVVTTRDPDTDGRAASELLARGNVVVFAPFAPPDITAVDGRVSLRAGEHWHILPGELLSDWRLRFLRWVQDRLLGETMLDANALDSLVARLDPAQDLFTSPGSLLALCAVAHDAGEARLKKMRASDLLEEALERLVRSRAGVRNEPEARWLARRGIIAFKTLSARRFDALALPVGRGVGLPIASWASLVPGELTDAPVSMDDQERELDALLAGAAADNTARARDLLQRWSGTSANEVARILEAEGFLRGVASGGLDLHPAWLQRLVWTLGVQSSFTGHPAMWGRWCLEPGRRQIVRALLSQLNAEALEDIIRRVLESIRREDPATVCALEVTFEVVANHLHGRLAKRHGRTIELIQALWKEQFSLCVEREPGLPTPIFGRPDSVDGHERWVADCWALSVSIPRPSDVTTGLDWLLPGWGAPTLDEVPLWLTRVRPPWADGQGLKGSKRLGELAIKVIEHTGPGRGNNPVPAILRVAAWLGSDEMRWRPGFSMIEALIQDRRAAAALAHDLRRTLPADRSRGLQWLWEALRGANPENPWRAIEDALEPVPRIKLLERADADLYQLLVDHLTTADIQGTLDTLTRDRASALDTIGALARNVAELPPRLRLAALRRILVLDLPANVTDGVVGAVLDVMSTSALTNDDLVSLERIAVDRQPSGSPATHARSAAIKLWEADHEGTVARAVNAWPQETADVWWQTASTSATPLLFARLEETPVTSRPSWTHSWLASRFPPPLDLLERMFRAMSETRPPV